MIQLLRTVAVLMIVFVCVSFERCDTLCADTVLSNLVQPSVGFGRGVGTTNPASSVNIMLGQGFRTGSDPHGYRLNSATLNMGGSVGSGLGDFALELYSAVGFGASIGPIGEFLVTGNPLTAGLYTFSFANNDLTLDPTTSYTIVASSLSSTGPTVSQYGWRLADFPTVFDGPGWLIGGIWSSTNGGQTWVPFRTAPLQFSLDATAIPEPSAVRLALAVALTFISVRGPRAFVA